MVDAPLPVCEHEDACKQTALGSSQVRQWLASLHGLVSVGSQGFVSCYVAVDNLFLCRALCRPSGTRTGVHAACCQLDSGGTQNCLCTIETTNAVPACLRVFEGPMRAPPLLICIGVVLVSLSMAVHTMVVVLLWGFKPRVQHMRPCR